MVDKILSRLAGSRFAGQKFQKNILLKNYTTFKIGGPAKYFFIAKSKENLITALKTAKDFKLPIFILGGGSNVLISDNGFKGLVVKIDIQDIEIQGLKIVAGAGVNLTKLAYLSAEKGLSGLEWMAGIPGSVGGAVFGNAHAFGSEIADSVEKIEAVDANTLEIKTFLKGQCHFSLKNSLFKGPKGYPRNLIIISAVFSLRKGKVEEARKKIKEHLEYRRERHPSNFPSAGSVFINPYKEQAWQLIKNSGLSGKIIGGAEISEKHTNFIVNLGEAKASDVLKLIKLAQKKVKKTFGINLETEIQLIGF